MDKNAPKVGIISLGCPKALVDSERILTKLAAEGYLISDTYDDADVVLINTCGFIDSARQESLEAIQEAMAENGRVIVTGCLGLDQGAIREVAPNVLAITGPHQYEQVVNAVHDAVPPMHDPFIDLVGPEGMKLTPRHYSYLKISEGCNHSCKFCIIPDIRGKLDSRPIGDVLREAERLVESGVKELLVISQDTSAYGLDLNYAPSDWHGKSVKTDMYNLANSLGDLGAWVRLHYVYPYPHVDNVIELMAQGKILPYLDIPFQHASPSVLKAMRRPAHQEKTLERIEKWRDICPDIAIRSTFIVGFPGETEDDFETLLDFLQDAQLDRVGCFQYENVKGAQANALPDHVDADDKLSRWERFMELSQDISERKLLERIGQTMEVLIDDVAETGAVGRTYADSPEIDGSVYLDGATHLKPGDKVKALITKSGPYDLWADLV
ncbi:30S ribosomal protein S12 methylthiotransferase RimO [Magnetovibrio blakemorei]|uniref:Ribosomal protein uS12 methylthiotransferase RimO n=1 Tax=Magnetovibrio blakemorei TaxID=28181 RepID=A0A1E5Q4S1_9PROT|nr:30S ribosomal protein S12 methylthiotransferase RimO [Magnetovibrio blakemorei]OEJ65258.1 ribosomal protein S12 methylthiotransferase [Magnetovibrio blakemorei]